MKSRFKYGAYITAFIAVLFTLLLIASFSLYLFVPDIPIVLCLIVSCLLIFLWLWLVWGELRTKIIGLEIGFDHLIVKRFFGLGKAQTYYFIDIEGYKTSILPARVVVYEYLYLMSGGKKVVKLSQFYHSNYSELKSEIISLKIKDLGYEEYKSGREVMEIFVKL